MEKKIFWTPWLQLFVLIFFVPSALVFLSPRFSIPVKISIEVFLLFLSTFTIRRTTFNENEIIFENPINPLGKTKRVKYSEIISMKIKRYNYVTQYPKYILLKTASKKHEIALMNSVDTIEIGNFLKRKNAQVNIES